MGCLSVKTLCKGIAILLFVNFQVRHPLYFAKVSVSLLKHKEFSSCKHLLLLTDVVLLKFCLQRKIELILLVKKKKKSLEIVGKYLFCHISSIIVFFIYWLIW